MADYRPIDFLNPLTPLRMERDAALAIARAAAGAAESVAKGSVDTAARGVATATEPMAAAAIATAQAATAVAGFMSLSVAEAADVIRDTNKKLLVGEVVLVVGVLAAAGIAAWYLTKSPEARAATKAAALTGGKFLLTKGMG